MMKRIPLISTIFMGVALAVMPAKGQIGHPLDSTIKRAEVILVGRLVSVPSPLNRTGVDFYRIVPDDVMYGNLATNSLFLIYQGARRTSGHVAKVQEKISYMLFLKKDSSSPAAARLDGHVVYRLYYDWEGIIALDENAIERRSVRSIADRYGVDVVKDRHTFIEAIRASVDDSIENEPENVMSDMNLPANIMDMYNALELTNWKKRELREQRRAERETGEQIDRGNEPCVTNMISTITIASEMPSGGDSAAVKWEEINSRWIRNYYADGAITMSDRTTHLMWVYDADANGTAIWDEAQDRCTSLIYAGHTDWFLPRRDQLAGICSQKHLFKDVTGDLYWSSTPFDRYAYKVSMGPLFVFPGPRYRICGVWPCRLQEKGSE